MVKLAEFLVAAIFSCHQNAQTVFAGRTLTAEDRSINCAMVGGLEQFERCNSSFSMQRVCPCTCNQSCREERKEIAEERIHECCAANGIKSACAPLCSYSTDPKRVQEKSVQCFGDLKRWLYCAADGQKNAACCAARRVPSHCLKFCLGELPPLEELLNKLDDYMICLQRLTDILACHRDNIPSNQTWTANHFS